MYWSARGKQHRAADQLLISRHALAARGSAFTAGLACLFAAPLVRRALDMSRTPALAGNLTLLLRIHRRETASTPLTLSNHVSVLLLLPDRSGDQPIAAEGGDPSGLPRSPPEKPRREGESVTRSSKPYLLQEWRVNERRSAVGAYGLYTRCGIMGCLDRRAVWDPSAVHQPESSCVSFQPSLQQDRCHKLDEPRRI